MKELMILGTFHFESQADATHLSAAQREQLAARRDEIGQIAEKLAAYRPTKLFVECEKTRQDALDKRYRAYLTGGCNARNDEVAQIGFRVARQNGIVPTAIDWMELGAATRPYGEVAERLEQDAALHGELAPYARSPVNLARPVLENLRVLNQKEYVEGQKAFYVNLARLGIEEYFGMGWLIWWYQRNLHIFGNISAELTEDDRGMLLIGAAHKGILEEFFADSKTVSLVDPLDYLA